MTKFQIGDSVKVTEFGYNVSSLTAKIKSCATGGVYSIKNWDKKVFTIISWPVKLPEVGDTICFNAYAIAYKGSICGYVYEEALERTTDEELKEFVLQWESFEELPIAPIENISDYIEPLGHSDDVLIETSTGCTVGYYDFTEGKWFSNLDPSIELEVIKWTYFK